MVHLTDGRAEREGVAARRLRETRAAERPPTPVDVLTGFLGAGKTTLVQRLLTNPPNGARIGVVVNDLAATNIDAVLLADGREEDGVVRLQNGCACCSLGGGLLTALDNLRKGGERRGYDYDQVVVECSGVARPQNITRLLSASAVPRMALRHVVAVVDTAAFHNALASRERADIKDEEGQVGEKIAQLLADQLEVADTVVLNKLDLCSDEVSDKVEQLVRGFSPGAAIQRCRFSEVNLVELFKTSNSVTATAVARADAAAAHVGELHMRSAESHVHGGGHGHGDGDDCDVSCSDGHSQGHGSGGEAHGASHDNGGHQHGEGHGQSHTTSHGHGHSLVVSEEHAGLSSFVYRCNAPLRPQYLSHLFASGALRFTDAELPDSCTAPEPTASKIEGSEPIGDSALRCVLRSKGFIRLQGHEDEIYFWSLAGTQFSLRRYTPPGGASDAVLPAELASLIGAEIVFIGIGVQQKAASIAASLDACT